MIGTDRCVYETPCHWCFKWDKKCDKQIGNSIKSEPTNNTVNSQSKPCHYCKLCGWDMPQCKDCNVSNNFKYLQRIDEE